MFYVKHSLVEFKETLTTNFLFDATLQEYIFKRINFDSLFLPLVRFNFCSEVPIEELLGFRFRSQCWIFQNKSSQSSILIYCMNYIHDRLSQFENILSQNKLFET